MNGPDQNILQQQALGDATTDWSQTIAFDQFDPMLGTLQAIDVGLTADVTGSVSVESLEAAPSTVSVSQSGNVTVSGPSGVPLTDATPDAFASASFAAYDGSTDDSGASGGVLLLSNTALSETDWQQGSIDLGPFIGTGTVPLSVGATTSLHVQGPANLQIASQASAGATVVLGYGYTGSAPDGQGSGTFSGINDFFNFDWLDEPFQFLFSSFVTTVPQTFFFADSTTGWTNSIDVNRFDPALGTLESVNVTLSGDLATQVEAENEDPTGASVSVTQDATLALTLPGTTETASALIASSIGLAGYDGSPDFAGASGAIEQGHTVGSTTSAQLGDAADLAAFIGTGTVAVPIAAIGTSSLDGPGNLLATLLAQAGATATVSYTYLPLPVIACFAGGTRIATARGRVTVEHLSVGDPVELASGNAAPIIWIGHRTIDCRHHPSPHSVHPVRIHGGAFAPNVPCRDLRLSPDHAVFVDGVLIPIKHLINGTSITQESRATIEYFHIELPRHDILLAEGLPTESYLDTGDRANFANGGRAIRLHPDFAARRWEAQGCAPLVVTGPALAAVRARLAERAAVRPGRRSA